jgi:hypothetical protein
LNQFLIKLTGRKLWVAIGGAVALIMTAQGFDASVTTEVASLIGAAGLLISFILTEGWKDIINTKAGATKQVGLDEIVAAVKLIIEAAKDEPTSADSEKTNDSAEVAAGEGEK